LKKTKEREAEKDRKFGNQLRKKVKRKEGRSHANGLVGHYMKLDRGGA